MTNVFGYVHVVPDDAEMQCDTCNTRFQPSGIDGPHPCPDCGREHPGDDGPGSLVWQQDKIVAFVRENLPSDVRIMIAFEVIDERTPFLDRPKGIRIRNDVQRDDHVIVTNLSRAWTHASDFVTTAHRPLVDHVTIHAIDERLTITPTSEMLASKLINILADLQHEQNQAMRHRQSRKRRSGQPLNQHAGYGFQRVRTTDGKNHRVPYEPEQKLMRQLLDWREQHMTFQEITELCRRRKVRDKRGQFYRPRTMARLHEAAKKMFVDNKPKETTA